MVLSVEECTFLVEHVFGCGGEYTQDAQQWFQAQFPETKVPHHNAVWQLIQKFRETGSMCDATRSGRASILTEKEVLDISDRMLQSLKKPIRKLSQQFGVSYGMAHTALKNHLCLHPYKITAVHEFKPCNSAKRVAYCMWFLDFLDREGEDILDVTFFTEGAHLHLSGYINSQNSRVWCAHNPHAFHESPLLDEKIGVWVGMSHRHTVRPTFFSETLNSQQYCDNIVYPFIAQLKEYEIDKAYFQQDGATAHTAHMSMSFLDDVFADKNISKTIWPPRSPDLSSPKFFSGAWWKTQRIWTIPTQFMIWRWPTQNTFGMWSVLYWTRFSRTQFGVSINVWRLAGDTLNITCNFLYCNHQEHTDF